MSGDQAEQIVAEAQERALAILLRAQEASEALKREAAAEVDRIRQQVLDATGYEITEPSPPKQPSAMDVQLGELAELALQCHHLLAAVEVLSPHVQVGETRTVGALAKAGVDLPTAAIALDYLRKSRFFADEGEDI